MERFKDASKENAPSAKSLNELMNLLWKLNAELREKISPSKKKNLPPEKMEVVIIIMTSQEEKGKSYRTSRSSKTDLKRDDWIHDLCQEIEQGPQSRK